MSRPGTRKFHGKKAKPNPKQRGGAPANRKKGAYAGTRKLRSKSGAPAFKNFDSHTETETLHETREEKRSSSRKPATKRDFSRTSDYAFRKPRGKNTRQRPPQSRGNRADKQDRQDLNEIVLEKLEAITIRPHEYEGYTWQDLGIGHGITEQIVAMGAEAPFAIQSATIPVIIGGRNVLGRARTGSGKTLAFSAPLIERLLLFGVGRKRTQGRLPKALIMAPTRELALQIDRTVQPLARRVGMFTTQIYGGVPQSRQSNALKRGVDIVIGTAGRIEDLIEQGILDLSEVVITVLDEADHMCELGFLEPVQRILRETHEGGQRLLFSATLDERVLSLTEEFLPNAVVFEAEDDADDLSTIQHDVVTVDARKKVAAISRLLEHHERAVLFCRTKAGTDSYVDQLQDEGIHAVGLHGDLSQAQRTRNLARFREGKVDVLVATDVAARGIHIDKVPIVIQVDLPDDYKSYIHRAGRTGRAGNVGRVVSLASSRQASRVQHLLKQAEIDAQFLSLAEL